MDPHRHHEYLANSDDRTRPMYINQGTDPARGAPVAVGSSLDDVRSPHLQYYTSNRDLLVKKPARYGCTCNGSNTMCNGCLAANSMASVAIPRPTEESWTSSPSSTRQSPIYINTNQHHHMSNSNTNNISGSNSRSTSYWPPEEHVMHRGLTGTTPAAYLDTRKPPMVQSNYQNYKSIPISTTTITQVTQTTRPSAIKHYTSKERFYEETKYAIPSVVAATPNIKIPNYATSVSIYDVDGSHRPLEHPIQCSNTVRAEHIVNPSNALAPSEQQPSPNYARKCPQIYAPSLTSEQHATSHQSLYMATPQFSSEKFQTIAQSATQKFTRASPQDHQASGKPTATTVEFRGSGALTLSKSVPRIRESSPQPITHSSTYRATKPLQYLEQEPPHLPSRPTAFGTSASTGVTSVNYYTHNNHHINAESGARNAELTPVIMKSTTLAPTSHYVQYSKSPLPQTAQYSASGTELRREKFNYMKLESEGIPPSSNPSIITTSRGLYNNPYKTPPPTESNCCKESSSPYSSNSGHSYLGETPHGYPTKYSKLVQESNSTHKLNHHALTPPPALQPSTHISHSHATSAAGSSTATSRSHSASSSYYYGAQSPATASAASPSPQMHHAVYTSTPPPSTIPPPPGAAIVVTQALSIQASHTYPHQQHQQQQAPVIMPKGYTPSGDICCSPATLISKTGVTPGGKQLIQSSKKLQTPKPNYRELINELMMRNTASEEELNMQIIKKTLNVNSPQAVARVPNNTISVVVPIKTLQTTSGVIHQRAIPPSPTPQVLGPNVNHIGSATSSISMPQIKQELIENKPAAYSPLDLSMRTVKTKADSTEYKFRHKNSVDYKHGLPRIDITPNFSAASVAQRLSTPPTIPSRNEQQAYSPPVKEHSKSSNAYNHEAYNHHYKSPQPSTTAILQLPVNSMVIKSTSRQQEIAHSQCARPSVLVEPNSYSKLPVASTRQMLAVEQLPPDTSIVVLPKATQPMQHEPNVQPTSNRIVVSTGPLDNDQVHPLKCKQPTQSAYINNNLVHSEQLNPNYLGRKRHLQEYSNANKYINNNNNTQEPYNKQPRQLSPTPHIVPTPQLLPSAAEIPVIAINEHALDLERRRANENLAESDLSVSNKSCHNELPVSVTMSTICKQEPLTPTADSLPSSPAQAPPPRPIKAERIRTKAELKGFTFNTPPMVVSSIQTQIKIEPDVLPTTQGDVPNATGHTDEYNSHSLLDVGWSNACNSFVEQLLTNSEKRQQQQQPSQVRGCSVFTKTTASSASDMKQELSEDDLPVAFIAQKKLNKSVDKCLPEVIVSTATSTSVTLQKKLSKLDREKKRLVQEKRLAARLPDGSSSESDNELDKRKSERQKKPLRKGKSRRLQLEKTDKTNESSDHALYTSSEVTDAKSYKVPYKERQQVFKEADKTDEEKTVITTAGKSIKCESDRLKEVDRSNKSNSVTSINPKEKANKMQYSSSNKNCVKSLISNQNHISDELKPLKQVSNKKLQTKIALNTMTRSKRKKELELQLANSKVLRNDKIIRNSTTKIKRKYVRKLAAVKEATKDVNVVGTRLRARKPNELPLNGRKLKSGTATGAGAASEPNMKGSTKSSKTQQQNLYLEMYRFKRALKIPPSLITVENMNHHKIAASLPDLERGNAMEELTGFKNAHRRKPKALKSNELRKTSKPCKESESESAPKSIIDVLHSRITNSVVGNKPPVATTASSKASSVVHNFSETSQNTESTSVYELPLPTPIKKPVEDFDVKRHFSIFDTKVLQSKTRTESKLQQKREIIREIFVGPDRPASAPPDMPRGDEISSELDGGEFYTGESYKKCEQFLEQMNRIIRQNKSKFTRVGSSTLTSPMNTNKRELEDTECTNAIDAEDKHDNALNHTSNIPGAHLHRRKYLRRKGSSGFDYIRKKKKPTNNSSQASSNVLSVSMQNLHPTQIKMEKVDDDVDLDKTKTEDDVCREIQKWVLNKGVGQSTMHKAARQGYIDVVVYCLDRIGMNPNQKDNAGYTPLHEACTHGWLEIARILLEFGANHSEAAQAGIRPLHGAIENDHEEVVRLLLSYGADPLLATYSGQTPLMLASSKVMRGILNGHLSDAQSTAKYIQPMRFPGPWELFDSTEFGYDIFDNVPNIACDMSRALLRKRQSRSSTVLASNGFTNDLSTTNTTSAGNNISNGENGVKTATTTKTEKRIEDGNSNECNSDSDLEHDGRNENELNENFEFEETDVLLPPLYLLKDEGSDKWVLLNDLCNLLKVKSKDTLLNKICPGSTSTSTMASAHKNLLREYKMSDFLEKATCMQLLCAGEKLNIGASKVVLIKYNESVKNLLGVKTILMKF